MNKLLLILILIALIIRISGALLFPAFSGGDEWFHYEIILNKDSANPQYNEEILQYYSPKLLLDYYSHTPIYYFLMNPLKDFYVIRLIQSFISVISILVAFYLIHLISGSKSALYGVAFITFLPTHIIYSATINPDILCSLFAFIMFYFLFKEIKKGHHKYNVPLAMLFFGLAFLTKLLAMWLIIPLILGVIYSAYKNRTEEFNYLILPFLLLIYFFLFNIRHLSWYGTNLATADFGLISIIQFFRTFAGFFLQEYGTAIIPDERFLFFLFFMGCGITLIYYLLKKPINFNAVNSLSAITIITTIIGIFYMASFYVHPQGRYLFTVLPFIPFAYYKTVDSPFWRMSLIYALILLTALLFASIHYGQPICAPYPMPECTVI